jgi:hypothetical protein
MDGGTSNLDATSLSTFSSNVPLHLAQTLLEAWGKKERGESELEEFSPTRTLSKIHVKSLCYALSLSTIITLVKVLRYLRLGMLYLLPLS